LEAVKRFLLYQNLLEIQDQPYHAQSPHEETIIYATGAVDPSVSGGIIPNKGEALLVQMPEWKMAAILKDEVFIVPLADQDLYWVGSYYQPWPQDHKPSEEGRKQILASIRNVYHGPIDIIEHMAGIRPTVDDRRPVIGAYPGHQGQYIFNGMGTKGTSLAPFWAEQLIAHIVENAPLPAQISPARYISG
jgi:glycine/D-amino acid oxidase-like deaminating enzyme